MFKIVWDLTGQLWLVQSNQYFFTKLYLLGSVPFQYFQVNDLIQQILNGNFWYSPWLEPQTYKTCKQHTTNPATLTSKFIIIAKKCLKRKEKWKIVYLLWFQLPTIYQEWSQTLTWFLLLKKMFSFFVFLFLSILTNYRWSILGYNNSFFNGKVKKAQPSCSRSQHGQLYSLLAHVHRRVVVGNHSWLFIAICSPVTEWSSLQALYVYKFDGLL
jgi:hypothetical protein